ncbi:hypothetical protein [Pandoraea pulmonicola]|uniref:hypothetical protein n=1 Tax=Pandoraea pulmonicola TaxID=93221 RepID=UPI001F3674ED|nr:hypothetical protein [Pandoraea pulmonicola]
MHTIHSSANNVIHIESRCVSRTRAERIAHRIPHVLNMQQLAAHVTLYQQGRKAFTHWLELLAPARARAAYIPRADDPKRMQYVPGTFDRRVAYEMLAHRQTTAAYTTHAMSSVGASMTQQRTRGYPRRHA